MEQETVTMEKNKVNLLATEYSAREKELKEASFNYIYNDLRDYFKLDVELKDKY